MHFSKKTGRLSLAGPKILTFGSHSMANFQSILDCFIPNFKVKHQDLENIKTDCVYTVAFNLHQIKRPAFFMGHPENVTHLLHILVNLIGFCKSSVLLDAFCLPSSIITLWFDIRNFDNSLLRKKNYLYLLNRFQAQVMT